MLYPMKPRWPCLWTFLSKFVKIIINSIIEFVNKLLYTHSGWKEPARITSSYPAWNKNREGCDILHGNKSK